MRPLPEWADLKYAGPRARVAHAVAFGDRLTLCGEDADDMHGTGDFGEIERAAELPLCTRCLPREKGSNVTGIDPAVAIWDEAMQFNIPREKGI